MTDRHDDPGPEREDDADDEEELPGPMVERILDLGRKHGWVVTTKQLREIGLAPSSQRRRRQWGLITPIFHGVHLVGRRDPTLDERHRAALLVCGDGSTLAFRTLAARHRILKWTKEIEVITPTHRRRRTGIRPRHLVLDARDVTTKWGLLVTTVHRLMCDLATVLSPKELELAVHEAEHRKLLHPQRTLEALERAGPRPGRAHLERLLLERRTPPRAETRLEARAHRFLLELGITGFETHVTFELRDGARANVDVLLRDVWLAIEVQGPAHRTVLGRKRDAARDAALLAVHDLPVFGLSDLDLDHRPAAAAADLLAAIAARSSR